MIGKSAYFMDIPYTDLKRAVEEIEKQKVVCDYPPCGRFRFDFIADYTRHGFGKITNEEGSNIRFHLIVCDEGGMGGKSVGTAAAGCRNCVLEPQVPMSRRLKDISEF